MPSVSSLPFGLSALVLCAGVAHASDTPVYGPPPAWVVPPPPLDPTKLDASSPVVLIRDRQVRMEGGTTWSYRDMAMRVATPEMLGQAGTVTAEWMPDQGDMIVHSVQILRGAETIDVLGAGTRFAVLRREQDLDRRMLDGKLTATLTVPGLRTGDILRVRMTISSKDEASKGNMDTASDVIVAPARTLFARNRVSWPIGTPVKWRTYVDGPAIVPTDADGYRTIEMTMPWSRQPDLPKDIPNRFVRPPRLEVSSFADWQAVSRTMAPVYATDKAILPGSPLAAEVARIAAADRDPLKRAAAALRLVQDRISYLALGMDGGNLVPQAPAKTWDARYGDCKAKTLLLLAMLRQLGIAAEPVLVSVQTGDFVNAALPSLLAFDHVFVRAEIGGRSYWLDGTRTGTRLADIGDAPPFYAVLPVRAEGAGLMPVPTHVDGRPDTTTDLTVDETAGLGRPEIFTTKIGFRGPQAARLQATWTATDAKARRKLAEGIVNANHGQAQLADFGMTYDADAGVATLTATALRKSYWRNDTKRWRMPLDRAVRTIKFDPDRSRPVWKSLPVATGVPGGLSHRMTVLLPDGGKGFVLEGDTAVSATIAGVEVKRSGVIDGGALRVDQQAMNTGAEIAPDAIAGERAKLAEARTRELAILAPRDLTPRWRTVLTDGKSRFAKIEDGYAKVIAADLADDPNDVGGYEQRAAFRAAIYDYRGAIADLDKVIGSGETIDRLIARSDLHATIGEKAAALADAKAAFALDPGSRKTILRLAKSEGDSGAFKDGIACAQGLVDQGGADLDDAVVTKAALQARSGDAAGAVATLDAAITERPTSATLLNERCWTKAKHQFALDTALADCTRAIELAGDKVHMLDSRAMTYWRLGRTADALGALDAILDIAPNHGPSLYLRGIIRRKTGRSADGDLDIKGALMIWPQLGPDYAAFSVTP